jgi:hypothetical protein
MSPVPIVTLSSFVLFATTAKPTPSRTELLTESIAKLVGMQEPGGQWPYEGVYRVNREIPVGYRVGGTSLVASTLMHADPDNPKVQEAVKKAVAFVVKELDHPLMKPSTDDKYDVRVWGHSCALDFLCQVRTAKNAGEQAGAVDKWIPKLVETLIIEELPGGGWNYANRRQPASFVTAPVAQSLLAARAQGEKVPDELLIRARKSLERNRTAENAFAYSGSGERASAGNKPAGSAARSAVCETTLVLLGGGSIGAVRGALNAFHEHWDELKKRHQQIGTHVPPFQIAPYYFYYGHRYAAQAIELLPESERAAQRERLLQTVLRTRDADGTWNDRVFPRSRNYGTAMIVLTLLADRAPLPPRFEPAKTH